MCWLVLLGFQIFVCPAWSRDNAEIDIREETLKIDYTSIEVHDIEYIKIEKNSKPVKREFKEITKEEQILNTRLIRI